MMFSTYKLNKQDDNIQLWYTLFPILNVSVVQSPVLFLLVHMQAFQETGKVVWCSHLFKNFPQFVVSHKIEVFNVVNEEK